MARLPTIRENAYEVYDLIMNTEENYVDLKFVVTAIVAEAKAAKLRPVALLQQGGRWIHSVNRVIRRSHAEHERYRDCTDIEMLFDVTALDVMRVALQFKDR